MNRDSFIFYKSFYEAIKGMQKDIQGEIYTAIMEYGLYGNEIENLDPIAHSIFVIIRPLLDAQRKKRKRGAPKGSSNNPNGRRGKKGCENERNKTNSKLIQELNKPDSRTNSQQIKVDSGSQNPNNQQNTELIKLKELNPILNNNRDYNRNYKYKKEKTAAGFSPPSKEEVENYVFEKGYPLDVERFMDHYRSNGWMVGRAKMKDWKAAVRNWVARDRQEKARAGSTLNVNDEWQ